MICVVAVSSSSPFVIASSSCRRVVVASSSSRRSSSLSPSRRLRRSSFSVAGSSSSRRRGVVVVESRRRRVVVSCLSNQVRSQHLCCTLQSSLFYKTSALANQTFPREMKTAAQEMANAQPGTKCVSHFFAAVAQPPHMTGHSRFAEETQHQIALQRCCTHSNRHDTNRTNQYIFDCPPLPPSPEYNVE